MNDVEPTLVPVPFLPSTPDITTALAGQVEITGIEATQWDASTQTWKSAIYTPGTGWSGDTIVLDATSPLGLQLPSGPLTLRVSLGGLLPHTDLTQTLFPGLNHVGTPRLSTEPLTIWNWDVLGFAGSTLATSDVVYDPANQPQAWLEDDQGTYVWKGAVDPQQPGELDAASAYFYEHKGSQSIQVDGTVVPGFNTQIRPAVTSVVYDAVQNQVEVTVTTPYASSHLLDLFYQDLTFPGGYDPEAPWSVWSLAVPTGAGETFTFSDSGDVDRPHPQIPAVRLYQVGDAALDTDSDGLSDTLETLVVTSDPSLYDTDSDGVSDGDEFLNGTDPITPENHHAPVVDAGPDQTVFLTTGPDEPWTPAEMITTGWYDASDAATLTHSGGAVSQWNDKSGNGLNFQASAGQEPVTGTASINGLNALDFDGGNDQLSTASNPFGALVEDAFVIAVHHVDKDSDIGTMFSLTGTSATSSRWQAHVPWYGNIYFDTAGTSGGRRLQKNYNTNTGDAVLVSFYGSTTDDVQQVYKNGSLLVADSSGHSVSPVGNIFVGSAGGTQSQDTTIGELIIINGTVSPNEREKLEGYLAHKWGLANNLPAAHPYKAAPPVMSGISSATATLEGEVTDQNGQIPTNLWTMTSGPGTVSFADDTAVDTLATFDTLGSYVLRLTGDDGLYQTYDEVIVEVVADTDNDGLPDNWELSYGLDPQDPSDASSDLDGDELNNLAEFTAGTDPSLWDTDGDTIPDLAEVELGLDPLVAQPEVSTQDLVFHVPLDGDAQSTTGSYVNPRPWFVFHDQGVVGGCIELKNQMWLGGHDGPYTQRTVSFWFSPAYHTGGPSIVYRSGNPNQGFNVYLQGGTLYAGGWDRVLDAGDVETWDGSWISSDAVQPGRWHHVTLVLDASADPTRVMPDVLKLYLDGQLVGTAPGMRVAKDGGGRLGGIDHDWQTLTHDGANRVHKANGVYDEVKAWNRALSPGEVARLAYEPLSQGEVPVWNQATYLGADNLADKHPGALLEERWMNLPGDQVSDFITHPDFSTAPDFRNILVGGYGYSDSDMGFGSRIRGYLVPSESGYYRIALSADNTGELWLSPTDSAFDRAKVAYTYTRIREPDQFDTVLTQQTDFIYLQAGSHYYLEILHKEVDSYHDDHLHLAWLLPGSDTLTTVPAENLAFYGGRADDPAGDGLPAAWKTAHGLDASLRHGINGAYGDFDGDGLSNLEEYQLGTHPGLWDTSGNGISDGDQVDRFGGDALADVNVTLIHQYTGDQATSVQGSWIVENGGLYAEEGRGRIGLALSIPEDGIYELDIHTHTRSGLSESYGYDYAVYIDGEFIERVTVAPGGAATVRYVLTPWLDAGLHDLEIELENTLTGRQPQYNTIGLSRVQGPVDANGIDLWAMALLASRNGVETTTQQSYTSPMSLEGKGRFLSMLDINQGALTAEHAPDNRFHLEVPLDAATATDVDLQFENGGLPQNVSLTWAAYPLAANNDPMILRAGETLQLIWDADPTPTGDVEFRLDGTLIATQPAADPLLVPFTTAGVYDLTATLGAETRTLSVDVRTANLGEDFVVLPLNQSPWTPPVFTEEQYLEADTRLRVDRIPGTTISYDVSSRATEPRTIAARTHGETPVDGRILDTVQVKGLKLTTGNEVHARVDYVFADGTELISTGIVLEEVPEGIEIDVNIFVAGVTFTDGTTFKTLTAADFDEYGRLNLQFLKSPQVDNTVCHRLHVRINGVDLGSI